MNKDEKLKELEEKQRALADEIRALRENKEEEFIRGRFYGAKDPKTVVVATGSAGNCEETFSGINISTIDDFQLVNDDGWSRDCFAEVIPKWLTPWELKNPPEIDFSEHEHSTYEIPDWWLCECWDCTYTHERRVRFFDGIDKVTLNTVGQRTGAHWDHYRMIPAEEWPEWARDAWRNRREK